MPKKIALSPEHEQLMRQLFSSIDYSIGNRRRRPKGAIKPIVEKLQAAGLDLCEDSIRRRACALGLMEPVGGKYMPRGNSARTNVTTWTRPCMNCKSTKPRPKNLYLCESCRRGA